MMRKLWYILIAFSILFVGWPQSVSAQKYTIKAADKAFDEFAFMDAIEWYTFAYERDTLNTYVIRRLAEANKNIKRPEEVEKWLKKIIDREQYEPDDLFEYSEALRSNGKYQEAQHWLGVYAEMRPSDSRLNMQSTILQFIRVLQQDSSRYVVEHLPFNTRGQDFGPAWYRDGLVFASSGEPGKSFGPTYKWNEMPFLNIYRTTIDDSRNFSDPEYFSKKLKTNYHDGPASFSPDFRKMYFNRNSQTSSMKFRKVEEENKVKVYIAEQIGDDWELVSEFKYNSDEYSVNHPCLSKDGLNLFFSSDKGGGYGGADLYVCHWINGDWSEPMNLGPKVNTEGNEAFPYIGMDGVLYFASSGHGGMGGLDIFMALPSNGQYVRVENMGYPVNSSRDDFGLIVNERGMQGYFASNRPGGEGDDDIYFLDILRIPVYIAGTVYDRITSIEIPEAKVHLLDENMDTVEVAYTRDNGQFRFEADKERRYTLFVSKPEYTTAEKVISTFGRRPYDDIETEMFIELDLEELAAEDDLDPLMMELVEGQEVQILQIEHINYDFDRHSIRPDAKIVLDKIAETLIQYPELDVWLESHTDSKGSDDYNLVLSRKRARSAYEYLVSKGVKSDHIEYTGFGETQLLNECDDGVECSDEQHALNRRSIIKVVRKGTYRSNQGSRSKFYF